LSGTVVITGVFSYTGKYATRLLLERGYGVRTLTNHPPEHDRRQNPHVSQRPRDPSTGSGQVGHPGEWTGPFGGQVEVFPYNFDQPEELRRSLEGCDGAD
jgi:NADH dehydrogenase